MPFNIDDIRVRVLHYSYNFPERFQPFLQGVLSGIGVQEGLILRMGEGVYDLKLIDFLKTNAGKKIAVTTEEFNRKQKVKYLIEKTDFVGETEHFRKKDLIAYFEGFEMGLSFVGELLGAISHPKMERPISLIETLVLVADSKLWLMERYRDLKPLGN